MARRAGWLLAVLFATPACAQVSGSVSLLSDARYRGVSLSDGAPTLQAAIAWDGADGWYGGMQLTRVRLVYPSARTALEAAPYFGYVHVVRPDVSIEAGAQYEWFSRSGRYAHPEVYFGLSGDRLHARIAWIDHYFGRPGTAWYGELNGDRPLHGQWRALAHVGLLREGAAGHSYHAHGAQQWSHDLAAGVGMSISGFELQALWTTSSLDMSTDDACAPWQCAAGSGFVMRVSHGW